MMSKYQKALNKIVENSCPKRTNCQSCEISNSCNSLMKDEVDTMQKLVDKTIPKKPINKTKIDDYASRSYENCNIVVCPNCGRSIREIYDVDSEMASGIEDDIRFCPFCGSENIELNEEDKK